MVNAIFFYVRQSEYFFFTYNMHSYLRAHIFYKNIMGPFVYPYRST